MRYIALLLLFISSYGVSQQIQPHGQFLKDSVKIGESVGYALSLKYPRTLDVVFPDSLFTFSPYELESKRYFPTRSDSTYSYDSAIYYLTTYEIDQIQYFKLPVFVLQNGDSTAVYSAQDSIFLKEMVDEVPDSVSAEQAPLIENTDYINVPLAFNYPYFIIGFVLLVIILLVVTLVFGKRIKNQFILYRLKKKHQKFMEKFDSLHLKQNGTSSRLVEEILVLWKGYLEKLSNRPYTKLTTKELLQIKKMVTIEDDLKLLDRIIYANVPVNDIDESYSALRQFAQSEYESKVEEVKHG